jgi:triosephosphate isomerase
MRRYFIAGNWKMNKTPSEAAELAKQLVPMVDKTDNRVMIAPSFVCLQAVADIVKGTNIDLGAQNMADTESGAHTGETSVLMLKEIGARVVILGHSERRHIYGESNELINRKVKLALKHGMEVILCIGETIEERETGKAEAVCFEHLEKGLKDVSVEDLKSVVIAYEPVWAIGTGKTATPDDAEAIHKACREKISGMYSREAADGIIIQYGGSVKPDNAVNLMGMDNIDGGLIGGASLKAESFSAIVNFNK